MLIFVKVEFDIFRHTFQLFLKLLSTLIIKVNLALAFEKLEYFRQKYPNLQDKVKIIIIIKVFLHQTEFKEE